MSKRSVGSDGVEALGETKGAAHLSNHGEMR